MTGGAHLQLCKVASECEYWVELHAGDLAWKPGDKSVCWRPLRTLQVRAQNSAQSLIAGASIIGEPLKDALDAASLEVLTKLPA